MSSTVHNSRSCRRSRVVALAVAAGSLLLLAPAALAAPMPVTAPLVPGTPALPGPLDRPRHACRELPQPQGVARRRTSRQDGHDHRIRAPARQGRDDRLADRKHPAYILDPKPDSLDYIGRKVDRSPWRSPRPSRAHRRHSCQLPGTGRLRWDPRPLRDRRRRSGREGRLPAQTDGKISPTRGPVGTTITVKVVGMGSPTYESVGASSTTTSSPVPWPRTRRAVPDVQAPAAGRRARTGSSTPARATRAVHEHGAIAGPVDGQPRMKFTITKDAGGAATHVELAGARSADHRRADDLPASEPLHRGGRRACAAEHDQRADPSKVAITAAGLAPSAPDSSPVVDGRREPRQLHRHVLELRRRAARDSHDGAEGR